jgi:signal transduction histidine kinase
MKPEITGEIAEGEDIVSDSREMLLKAGQEAEVAKAAARQAISQAFLQRENPAAGDGNLPEPTLQEEKDREEVELTGSEKLRLANKILNGRQSLLGMISEITAAYFTVKTLDAGAERDFYKAIIHSNTRLEELINELALEQARLRTDRALEEAKSDRIASRVAVQQAQDKLKKVIEDTGVAVRQAQEEAAQAKNEAQVCRRDAEEAINIARRLVKQARNGDHENAAGITSGSPVQPETHRAEGAADLVVLQAEAERVRRELAETIARAEMENRRVKEEAEAAVRQADEALKRAREDIIGLTMNEITRTRQEPEMITLDPGLILREPARTSVPDPEETTTFEEKDGGPLRLNKEIVPPHRFIADAVQEAQAETQAEKNVLLLSIPKILPSVEIDEKRVKQVLIELIRNAARLSSANNAINIRAEIRDNELLVQVKDHGAGISDAELSVIFDKKTHCIEEAGVKGLSVCREIVTAHGGQIRAESLEGYGSTFSFTLPLRHRF